MKKTQKKLTVGLLCGGHSVEHEISLLSAKSVLNALDQTKYDVVLIGIDKQGHFVYQLDSEAFKQQPSDPRKIALQTHEPITILQPGAGDTNKACLAGGEQMIDVVFPLVHGNTGEDGAIQGLLKLIDAPYVGSDILGCAITMDKVIAKQLMQWAGLPIPRFTSWRTEDKNHIDYDAIIQHIGLPCFVKPANSGSSVGINKATDKQSLIDNIAEAFLYDDKLLIEEAISGRELECAVLGNTQPQTSVIGEIITTHDFYSYAAKYLDTKSLRLDVPASHLTEAQVNQIQLYAADAFKLLGCSGMARVDFFMDKQGTIFINEINTIPGFTEVSMYPMLWEASGISYSHLIDRLIELALEKHANTRAIRHHVAPTKSYCNT